MGRVWPIVQKECVPSQDLALLAGEKRLIPASHHEGCGQEASRFAWTMEEAALQSCTEDEGRGQVGSGKTGSAIPQLLPLLSVEAVADAIFGPFALH